MKIIFSRKGFDLTAGGCPSPILPDGRLISLPIPDDCGPRRYRDVRLESESFAQLVEDLTNKQIRATSTMHFDPDLRRDAVPRARGWRPMFGQGGKARTHLAGHEIGVGDLFLFFGWFREVEKERGRYRYVRGAPHRHVLFGWLYVGERWESPFVDRPAWALEHPHLVNDYENGSTVFVASAKRRFAAGVFREFREGLVLTEPGASRSSWLVPRWMHPRGKKSFLSYHGERSRWRSSRIGTHLRTVGRGQEFVLNTAHYPEARTWANELISTNSGEPQRG